MGVVIASKVEIDEYFNSKSVSQSLLKRLLNGIDGYLFNKKEERELFYTEKGHLIIGAAVDTILTGEKEEFYNQYYVSRLEKKPSEVEMSIVQLVFNEVSLIYKNETKELSFYSDFVQSSIEFHKWQANWKIETKIAKIIEIGNDYFEDLKKGLGKQILTIAEKKLIDDIVFSLKSSERTSKFFDRTSLAKDNLVTVYYQLPIYFTYKNIECKALLDILIVVKNEQGQVTSVYPIDIKTMNGSTLQFPTSVRSFGYHIQAAWYVEALLAKNTNFETFKPETIKDFTFIVESNTFPGQPLIFECEEDIILTGKYGRPELSILSQHKYPESEDYKSYCTFYKPPTKGFDQLIDTYIYQTAKDWVEEQIITENKGILKLNWNGIINK